MNITDIDTSKEGIPKDIWAAIAEKQRELHHKYKGIEDRSGLGHAIVRDTAFSLNNPRWQYYLKEMAYRVIEELTEADEAFRTGSKLHMYEEEIDALHFLVELNVVLGQTLNSENALAEELPLLEYWDVVYELGMAGNCLKMKPWKQDPMLTDERLYREHIDLATNNLINLLRRNFNDEEIYLLYYKKHEVNKFRQRSNY